MTAIICQYKKEKADQNQIEGRRVKGERRRTGTELRNMPRSKRGIGEIVEKKRKFMKIFYYRNQFLKCSKQIATRLC